MDYRDFNIILGQQIKKAREEERMTQLELASLMNISAQNISSYERGERCPSMFWMDRLYRALGIAPGEFMEELYCKILQNC